MVDATARLSLRPARAEDVPALERSFAEGVPARHRSRVRAQGEGEGVYLLAWLGAELAGFVFLRFSGTGREPMTSALQGYGHMSDLFIREQRRSRGIGSALVAAAEAEAAGRGLRGIGLGVAEDNPRARRLYERLGYRNAGFNPYTSRWLSVDAAGNQRWVEERITYLVKTFPPREAPGAAPCTS